MVSKKQYLIEDTKPVELMIVLDRSGSMASIREDAIGGFNSFLEKQKELSGEANLSLVLFDHEYELVVDNEPLANVAPLNKDTYVPRGSTSLYDAIGRAMASLNSRSPKRAIVAILTDGEENNSKEFKKDQIKKLLKDATAKGWEVVYLAANQDAFAVGTSLGVLGYNNHNFLANSVGTQNAYKSMTASVASYRSNS